VLYPGLIGETWSETRSARPLTGFPNSLGEDELTSRHSVRGCDAYVNRAEPIRGAVPRRRWVAGVRRFGVAVPQSLQCGYWRKKRQLA